MKTMMKTTGALAALILLGACATVESEPVQEAAIGFTPPPVGTEIDWTYVYSEGDADQATSRVVATGDDFVIFLSDTSYSGEDSFDYFAEFSGVFFVTCDTIMPSVEERAAALALWPLTEGGATSISGDFGGDVLVGPATSVMVSSDPVDVVWTDFSYIEDGETYTDRAAVAPELGTVVEMRWGDGSVDLIRDIRVGEEAPGTILVDKHKALGNCESLLPK